MSKFNLKGLAITIYGVGISLALGVILTPNTPDFSKTICNVSTPIEAFDHEKQFAISVGKNDKCISDVKLNQFYIVSFLIFLAYIQFLRCLILASYLVSKYETKKNEEKFYAIENAEQMYSGLLQDYFTAKKPMFENIDAMKASYLTQKMVVDAFCTEIENRTREGSETIAKRGGE